MRKKIFYIFFVLLSIFNASIAISYEWKTISTEHFTIYYPKESKKTALKIEARVEKAFNAVSSYLNYKPSQKIPIVINRDSDYMNGYFAIFPNKIEICESIGEDINFFENTDDPLFLLIVHELTHFIHITTAQGIYKDFCTVLGSGTCILNMFSPGWLVEGLAVNAETKFTNGGRGRASYFDSYARSMIDDGKLWSLSAAGTSSPYFPPANRIYASGYYMIDYLANTYGEDIPSRLSLYQGRYPFKGTKGSVQNVTQKSSKEFYQNFLNFFYAKNEKIKKQLKNNLIQGQEVESQKFDNFKSFVWNKNGEIEAIKTSYDKKNSVAIISAEKLKIIKEYKTPVLYPNDFLSKSKNGELLFVSYVPFGLQNISAFKSELFSFDFKKNKLTQITNNEHIFSADISHKNSKIVSITRRDTENDIVVFDKDMKKKELLFSKQEVYCASPSWSFDETKIATVCKDKKEAKITIIDSKTKKVFVLKDDNFFKRDVSFSPDSKWLLFSSNKKNNIFNVYAYNLETESIYQLTSTLYGAFSPKVSYDGKMLAFITFYEGTKKIRVMEFNPQKGEMIGKFKLQKEEFEEGKTQTNTQKTNNKKIPLKAYTPFLHVPFFGYDDKGSTLGVFLMGQDPVGLDAYQTSISFGNTSGKVNYDISLIDSRLFPDINLRVYDTIEENNAPLGRKEKESEDFFIREKGLLLAANIKNIFQLSPSTLILDSNFGINYKKFNSVENYIFSDNKDSTTDYFAELNFNRKISSAPRDVIQTGGQNFYFKYDKASKDFGSDIEAQNKTYSLSQYYKGFSDNHGLEIRVAYQEQNGELSFSRDKTLPRGYKADEDKTNFNNDKNALLSLEYHFPIKYTDDGIGLILFHSFLIKGSIFIDWGAGFEKEVSFKEFNDEKQTSIGFTITNEINAMAIFPIEYGLEVAYKKEKKEVHLEFLLMLLNF